VIVVDTNLVAELYLGEDDPAIAERVAMRDPEWAVPMLWRYEFRNVLAGEMRRRRMTLDRAVRLSLLAEARVRGREFIARSDLVLELVSRTRCSACDCEFAALAQWLDVELVTYDRELLGAFPGLAVSPLDFASH
jgi:predicted nucleic acid-binding protein